jgi:hypothetical protein
LLQIIEEKGEDILPNRFQLLGSERMAHE